MNRFSILYEPLIWTIERLRERKQTSIRRAIKQKWGGEINPSIYWIKDTPKENEELSTNEQERTVQKLFLSNLGHYAAESMHNWRTYFLIPIMLVISLIACWHVTKNANSYIPKDGYVIALWTIIGGLTVLSTFLGSSFLWRKILPPILVTKEQEQAVEDMTARCLLRELPDTTPEDLKDRFRLPVVDRDGDSVAGQILAVDLEYSSMDEQIHEYRIATIIGGLGMILPLIAASKLIAVMFLILFGLFFGITIIGSLMQNGTNVAGAIIQALNFRTFLLSLGLWLSAGYYMAIDGQHVMPAIAVYLPVIILYACLFFYELTLPSPLVQRGVMLEDAVKDVATEHLIDAAGREYFRSIEQSKLAQIENASKDKTPFFKLGNTKALLTERRDPFAPTEKGKIFGLTLKDLTTHALILGATGTGKTSGVIRPLINQILEKTDAGIIILDGKGTLPSEFSFDDYFVVSPHGENFNPIYGMKPDAVAETIKNLFSTGDKDKFWSDAASICIRNAAMLLYHSAESYTIRNILKLSVDNEFRVSFLSSLNPETEQAKTDIKEAYYYFSTELDKLADNTRTSVLNNVSTWLRTITDHENLGKWTDTQDGFAIEDVLKGRKIGILLPEAEFGQGGALISSLVMRRIYDAVKIRGNNWEHGDKQCFMIIDEAQALISDAEQAILPIARSLGLSCIFSTQNIDGISSRLGKEATEQTLGNLSNLIALPPKTKVSNEYIQERLGKIWQAKVAHVNAIADASSDIRYYDHMGADKTSRATSFDKALKTNSARLAWSAGVWRRINVNNASRNHLKDLTLSNEQMDNFHYSAPNINIGIHSIIEADEITTLLAEPFTAIAIINRANSIRRDVIKLEPIFETIIDKKENV